MGHPYERMFFFAMFSSIRYLIRSCIRQLPYGTMNDDEMRKMPMPLLQDEGFLFLWVTGRAMEVGRECMRVWGYTRIDEVVWVKTNQVHFYSALFWASSDVVQCLAAACNPDRAYRPLVESHKRTHVGRCENRP